MKFELITKSAFDEFHYRLDAVLASPMPTGAKPRMDYGEMAGMFGDMVSQYPAGKVAIIPVHGPISRYDDFFVRMCGGTSIEYIRVMLQCALEDKEVSEIILDINSPGGTVDGAFEFADFIREQSAIKPINAYVGHAALSLGYLLAASCQKITMHPTAMVGGIGVLMSFDKANEESEIVFVSANTPLKHQATTSAEGSAQIMRIVNQLSTYFMDALAKFRNASAESVATQFGAGDVMFAESAVAAGMVDSVGTMNASQPENSNQNTEAKKMKLKKINGAKAAYVIVDDSAEGISIPEGESNPLTAEFIRQNMPDLAQEIADSAENDEMDRQGALDDMSDTATTDAEKQIIATAKKAKGKTIAQVSMEITAYRKQAKAAEATASEALLKQRLADGQAAVGIGAVGEGNQTEEEGKNLLDFALKAQDKKLGRRVA